MTTAATVKGSKDAGRIVAAPNRPLVAQCRATVTAEAVVGAKPKSSGGRWRINAGNEMQMVVEGVNLQQASWGKYPAPIRCVIDLAQAAFDKPVIPAFYAHIESMYATVGNWSGATITAEGIVADLTAYVPRTQAEEEILGYATAVKALLDQGHPWEASVGAYSADGIDGWELVPPGNTIACNGRSFDGDGDLPLYILRAARICEGSVVMYGADRDTGRIAAAAAALTSKETPMSQPAAAAPAPTANAIGADRIKTLRAAHPGHDAVVLAGLEAGKSDAEICTAVKDAQIASLTARAEAAETKLAAVPAAKPAPVVTAGKSETGEAAGAPGFSPASNTGTGTLTASKPAEFMRLRAEIGRETKLKGMALNEEVYARHPGLRPAV